MRHNNRGIFRVVIPPEHRGHFLGIDQREGGLIIALRGARRSSHQIHRTDVGFENHAVIALEVGRQFFIAHNGEAVFPLGGFHHPQRTMPTGDIISADLHTHNRQGSDE